MDYNRVKNTISVIIAVALVILWLFLGTSAYENWDARENEVSHECFGMP